LRAFLRDAPWPAPLSVAVLSARYGLIGGLAPIADYDQRMNADRARELAPECTDTLARWAEAHDHVSLVMGRDYLPALDLPGASPLSIPSSIIEGPIGVKLNQLSNFLHRLPSALRSTVPTRTTDRPLYFLPDWDDMLDVRYDFKRDRFSDRSKPARGEQHCIRVMAPDRMCDGILVSLAQHLGTKGSLRRFAPDDPATLAPKQIRQTFGLLPDQLAFGDCGAFSYIDQEEPVISTEQAMSLYQLYGFDLGASVDHIPAPVIERDGHRHELSDSERRRRIRMTRNNAIAFLELHRRRRCQFTPVGVIQALSPRGYATSLRMYYEMGYRHVALGGLVPKGDAEIVNILEAVGRARAELREAVWLHLFGVFRPRIQQRFRELGVSSFDSATYFRKAWLRSNQNYLATNGSWYAAIRVPVSDDPRTRKRLRRKGLSDDDLLALERDALRRLHAYDEGRCSLDKALEAVRSYDRCLRRADRGEEQLVAEYRRTLHDQPWKQCTCQVCQSAGIDVLIFRGYNRNKRRGAHNTLMLYRARGRNALQ